MDAAEARRRLEVQGFLGLSDEELCTVRPLMRFTPALNTMAVATAADVFQQDFERWPHQRRR